MLFFFSLQLHNKVKLRVFKSQKWEVELIDAKIKKYIVGEIGS